MSDATATTAELPGHDDHAGHYGVPGYDPTASKMGMWLFLFTELLLFGTLFIVFATYFYQFPTYFMEASGALSIPLGAFNTVVLLTSSLTMALAIAALQRGNVKLSVKMLNATVAFSVLFCIIKAFEWGGKFEHGIWPGSDHVNAMEYGQQVFYSLYFVMTGFHALHVIIGAGLILWVKKRTLNVGAPGGATRWAQSSSPMARMTVTTPARRTLRRQAGQ